MKKIQTLVLVGIAMTLCSCSGDSKTAGERGTISVVAKDSVQTTTSAFEKLTQAQGVEPFDSVEAFSGVVGVAPITSSATDTFVQCGAGQTRVGGGCKCGIDGNITRNLASNNNDWVCSCDNYNPTLKGQAYAHCANDAETTVTVQSDTSPDTIPDGVGADYEFVASCPSGSVAISASMSCSDNGKQTIGDLYPLDSQRWRGTCDGPGTNPRLTVYCVPTEAPSVAGKTIRVVSVENSTGTSASVSCPGSARMITGGCKCPLSMELDNSFSVDLKTWNCDCQNYEEINRIGSTAYALCAE